MFRSRFVVCLHDSRNDGVFVLTPEDVQGPVILRLLAECLDGDRIDIADLLRHQADDWELRPCGDVVGEKAP